MALAWGVLAGGGYVAVRRDRRGAVVVALLVVSHWVLDLPMHRPDLPLWPGSSTRVGLGLWNSVPATVAIELATFAIGLALYARGTRARDRVGRWGLWAMVAVLAAFFVGGLQGAPPSDEHALAVTALGLWLFVPWGWWVDRHREPVTPQASPRANARRVVAA
jgi:hypothetical protein